MDDSLGTLLETIVRREGFTLYHWSLKPGGRRRILKVFLHSETGVGLDDCARVSRRLAATLEDEEAVQGSYVLEVSSPGLDRPLFEPWHYETALGQRVRLVQRTAGGEQRSLEGVLLGMDDGELRLDLGEAEERLGIETVSRARVLGDVKMRKGRDDESHGGSR